MARTRPLARDKIFPALPEPLPLARFAAADDLRAAIGLWSAWLAGERRASAHTVAAYGRDLAFFLDFLTDHLGEPPSLAAIETLRPADFRAYLARRTQRVDDSAERLRASIRTRLAARERTRRTLEERLRYFDLRPRLRRDRERLQTSSTRIAEITRSDA